MPRTAHEWEKAGHTVGETVTKSAFEAYATGQCLNGVSKIMRGAARAFGKLNQSVKEVNIARGLSGEPIPKPINRKPKIEKPANQVRQSGPLSGRYKTPEAAGDIIPRAKDTKITSCAPQPSSSNNSYNQKTLIKNAPAPGKGKAKSKRIEANKQNQQKSTKNTQQAKTNQFEKAAQKPNPKAKANAEASGKYTAVQEEGGRKTGLAPRKTSGSKTLDDILSECRPGSKTTNKKLKQVDKIGNVKNAFKDFARFETSINKDFTFYGTEHGKIGKLPDGTNVIARSASSRLPNGQKGFPTLEIQYPNKKVIKIRYIDQG